MIATKDLTQSEFDSWKSAHHEAALAIEDREEKLDAIYDQIEKGLDLLGATAIEDKLQDGVGRTINNLLTAGIKVWVLTGDKQETAINIGYSCQLLSDDMQEEPLIVNGQSYEEVEEQFNRYMGLIGSSRLSEMDKHQKNYTSHPDSLSMSTLSDASSLGGEHYVQRSPNFRANGDALGDPSKIETQDAPFETQVTAGHALVVNGHSLVYALSPSLERKFVTVAEQCSGESVF